MIELGDRRVEPWAVRGAIIKFISEEYNTNYELRTVTIKSD